ncbi:MAG TPA: hypothetical protein VF868_11850 [Bacteroidia bacterium]|jgi:hypothetical protein
MKTLFPASTSTAILICIPIIIISASFILQPPLQNNFNIPYIKHNKPKTTACLSPVYMMNAWYELEGLHKFEDTLDLATTDEERTFVPRYEFYEDPGKNTKTRFSNNGLMILVDTLNEISMVKRPIWANYLFLRSFDENRKLRQDDTLIMEVKSFPVYITNMDPERSATLEQQDGSAMIVAQSLDKNNKWRNIEYWSHSWCGNSYGTTVIPPRHYLFTRGVKCSGERKSRCRLKLMTQNDSLFSNEFFMNINETQFRSPKQE